MNTQSAQYPIWRKWCVLVAVLLFLLTMFFTLPLQPAIQADTSAVTGTLPNDTSESYLLLTPTQNDTIVTIDLQAGPYNDPNIAGKVNMWVLSEQSMRDLLDGDKPFEVALAAGNPIAGKDDFQRRASFRAVGRQTYTILVYSDAPVPASYTVIAENATVVDPSAIPATEEESEEANQAIPVTEEVEETNQTIPVTEEAEEADQTVLVTEVAEEETDQAVEETGPETEQTAHLEGNGGQIFLPVIPDAKESDVLVELDYTPKDNGALTGNVHFFLFDNEGLRKFIDGVRPEIASFGSGTVEDDGSGDEEPPSDGGEPDNGEPDDGEPDAGVSSPETPAQKLARVRRINLRAQAAKANQASVRQAEPPAPEEEEEPDEGVDFTYLKLSFRAVAGQTYTLMVINRSPVAVDATLSLTGASFPVTQEETTQEEAIQEEADEVRGQFIESPTSTTTAVEPQFSSEPEQSQPSETDSDNTDSNNSDEEVGNE